MLEPDLDPRRGGGEWAAPILGVTGQCTESILPQEPLFPRVGWELEPRMPLEPIGSLTVQKPEPGADLGISTMSSSSLARATPKRPEAGPGPGSPALSLGSGSHSNLLSSP